MKKFVGLCGVTAAGLAVASDPDLTHTGWRVAKSSKTFLHLSVMYKSYSWKNRKISATQAYQEGLSEVHRQGAKMVLDLCLNCGGILVKAGQHAATLKPAVPDEYIEELRVLQDDAGCREFKKVLKVLEQELDVSTVFTDIDQDPLGTASLAQVHKGVLHNGQHVAIKVQHEGLDRIIATDLRFLKCLNTAASFLFKNSGFDLGWAIEGLEENLLQETDFLIEADNMIKVQDAFQAYPNIRDRIYIPSVYKNLCSKRVLVMEYVDAIPVYDLEELRNQHVDVKAIANTLVDAWATMFFQLNMVHCDPHAGNFLVCPETHRLVILDHGLYRTLDPVFSRNHRELWKAMLLQDDKMLHNVANRMGIDPEITPLIPFAVLSRTMQSQAPLGMHRAMTAARKEELCQQLGVEKLTLENVTDVFKELPHDLLWILRTMHLIKDLHTLLGGSNSSRFHIYAKHVAEDSFWFSMKLWWFETILQLKARFSTTEYSQDQGASITAMLADS